MQINILNYKFYFIPLDSMNEIRQQTSTLRTLKKAYFTFYTNRLECVRAGLQEFASRKGQDFLPDPNYPISLTSSSHWGISTQSYSGSFVKRIARFHLAQTPRKLQALPPFSV
jgi:hypothetical protein